MSNIVLDKVSIGYRNNVVAENLSAQIRDREFTCLIGRNGLGKSTLVKVLSGFIPPLSGKITIKVEDNDYDIARLSKKELSRLVAVVLTDKVDIANVSAEEVVGMGRMPYTDLFGTLSKRDNVIVEKCMEITGIAGLRHRDINSLSDGERQKVMIARALAQQTPIILLDEPTAFLDYDSKVDTMRLLHSLCKETNKVVLASTHDLDIAIRHADRMITIDNGITDVDKQALMSRIKA